MNIRIRNLAAFFLSSLLISACASSPGVNPAGIEADKAALIKTDENFLKTAEARGLAEAFVAFAAPDAVMMPGGSNPVTGAAAIRAQFADGTGHLTWKPFKAEVSKSGDLGYTLGTYELETRTEGQSVTRYGKYCSVWKKQTDGAWKWVVDIGNPSPPPQ